MIYPFVALYMIPIVIIVVIVLLIYLYVYYVLEYKYRPWRPFSKLSNFDDQSEYWCGELIDCFEQFDKIIQLKNYQNFELVTGIHLSKNLQHDSFETDDVIKQLNIINTQNKNNHFERLLLKYKLINKHKKDEFEVVLRQIFYHRTSDTDEDLETRYLLFDFFIDYTKTFCKYKNYEYYHLYFKENMNFYAKQALRDAKKGKKIKISGSDASANLLKSLQSALPYVNEPSLDVEKEIIDELKPYKAPYLSIRNENVDYLSDNYTKIIEEYKSSPSKREIQRALQEEIWTIILTNVAKVDVKHNYKLLTNYFNAPKDKIKNDLKNMVDALKRETHDYHPECLTGSKEAHSNTFNISLEDYMQSSFKRKLYAFEELINKLESKVGPGLLSMHYDTLMQKYHKLVLHEDYDENQTIIDRIIELPTDERKTYCDIVLTLHKMDILISKDLPSLLYFDMRRTSNVERTLLYYMDTIRRTGNALEKFIDTYLDLVNVFSNSRITKYLQLYISYLNSAINFIYTKRSELHNIADDIPSYIVRNFNWAIEGFRERYEEELAKADRHDGKGPIIEHFGGLRKFFRGIMSFIKTLIKIIQVITNPVKLIKLIIITLFTVFSVVVAMIERYTNIVTSIALIITIHTFMVSYGIFKLKYCLFMYILGFFDLGLLNGAFSRITYNIFLGAENDIRSWYNVPGHEQGNKVSRFLIGNGGSCSSRYDNVGLYCKKKPYYIPSFSHQSSIYKLYNNQTLSDSFYLFLGEFQPTLDFHKQPKTTKKRILKKANITKRIYVKNIDKYYEQNDNISNMNKTICSTISMLDIPSSKKEALIAHCRELYCKNGEYMSSCLQFKPTENQDMIHIDQKVMKMIFNSLSYILLVLVVVSILVYPFQENIDINLDQIKESLPAFIKGLINFPQAMIDN